jgi:hypothetical protein
VCVRRIAVINHYQYPCKYYVVVKILCHIPDPHDIAETLLTLRKSTITHTYNIQLIIKPATVTDHFLFLSLFVLCHTDNNISEAF